MRKSISPILATILLMVVGLVVAGSLMVSKLVGSSNEAAVYKLSIAAVYKVSPVSVIDARWQIALLVENQGNRDEVINKIYVNGKLLEEYGLIHGDRLSSKSSIGTSIPVDGLTLKIGRRETVYIWIGSEVYTSGTVINIELQRTGQIELRRTVTLS